MKRSAERWRWQARIEHRVETAELLERCACAYDAVIPPSQAVTRAQNRGGWRPEGVRVCRAMRFLSHAIY